MNFIAIVSTCFILSFVHTYSFFNEWYYHAALCQQGNLSIVHELFFHVTLILETTLQTT